MRSVLRQQMLLVTFSIVYVLDSESVDISYWKQNHSWKMKS